MLVWIDLEMTGLDLAKDALIEIAVLVTDGDLNVQDDGLDLLIPPSAQAMDAMGDFVRKMHTDSGLLDELTRATLTMAQTGRLGLPSALSSAVSSRRICSPA